MVRDFRREGARSSRRGMGKERPAFPSSVFKQRRRAWAFTGRTTPSTHGGAAGGDYWYSVVKAEEYPRCNSAGVTMGLLVVQSDMATPVISDLGQRRADRDGSSSPRSPGDKVAALGVSEPSAGSDVAGIKTTAKKRRRRLRHQRTEDLHHQRHPLRLHHPARPRRIPEHVRPRLLVLPGALPIRKGFSVARKLDKGGKPLVRHRRAVLRGHARARPLPAR